ncbi:MAG: beta-propeller domain-containing protein [Candidatus Aenigmatarchaeota archaeon]
MKGNVSIAVIVILFVALVGAGVFYLQDSGFTKEELKKFSSYEQLESFVKSNVGSSSYYGGFAPAMATVSRTMEQTAVSEASTLGSDAAKSSVPTAGGEAGGEYSETNIQVAGVDEADIVKNDGKYIYTVSGNKVVIINAYPAEQADIVSEIELNGTPQEIFVNRNKLVVFGMGDYSSTGIPEIGIAPRRSYSQLTFIKVYDITDRANPVLTRDVAVEGNYYDSRMIGDYVYVVASQPVYYGGTDPIPMPLIEADGVSRRIAASEIYYFDTIDNSYIFTNIISINTQNDNEEFNSKTYLMGYTQNMYVSPSNIYVVYTKRLSEADYYDRLIDQALIPNVPFEIQLKINEIRNSDKEDYEKVQEISEVVQEYVETLGPEQGANFMKNVQQKVDEVYQQIAKELEKTIIHKIAIFNGNIDYVTNGEAPGQTLNQFSMDEYNGNFRIATTTNNWRTQSSNHLYVLDGDLNIIGKVEDLASGERIYSVRFMGDRGYMVTFRQIDPLFVIDLSNPTNPQVLGYLKIPGVSDYLHPYDETHLIGVGRDATESGRISGMKLSLFDVSDVANPTEISKYIIGERGTYSEALNDHKAFLFSREKNLLVIPVREYEKDYRESFQGAYVFNVDLVNGFILKGTITHANETAIEDDRWYYEWNAEVRRSLYIDNVLYTVSNKMVKANDLSDLGEISQVELPLEDYYGYVRGGVGIAIDMVESPISQ